MDDDHTYEEMKKPAKAHIFIVGPSIPAHTDSLANLLSGLLLSLIPKLLICAVLCMFLGAAVFAAPFGSNRFALLNGCIPVRLEVVINSNGFGLTEDAIAETVRDKLVSAGIFDADAFDQPSVILVEIGVAGLAFHVSVHLLKPVKDLASEELNYAITWTSGSFGQHGRDPGYIMRSVSRNMDKFIDDYLSVNADACDANPILSSPLESH